MDPRSKVKTVVKLRNVSLRLLPACFMGLLAYFLLVYLESLPVIGEGDFFPAPFMFVIRIFAYVFPLALLEFILTTRYLKSKRDMIGDGIPPTYNIFKVFPAYVRYLQEKPIDRQKKRGKVKWFYSVPFHIALFLFAAYFIYIIYSISGDRGFPSFFDDPVLDFLLPTVLFFALLMSYLLNPANRLEMAYYRRFKKHLFYRKSSRILLYMIHFGFILLNMGLWLLTKVRYHYYYGRVEFMGLFVFLLLFLGAVFVYTILLAYPLTLAIMVKWTNERGKRIPYVLFYPSLYLLLQIMPFILFPLFFPISSDSIAAVLLLIAAEASYIMGVVLFVISNLESIDYKTAIPLTTLSFIGTRSSISPIPSAHH